MRKGNLRAAADNFLRGGKEIDNAFNTGRARGLVAELSEMKNFLFYNYVTFIDKMHPNPDEHIVVWYAAWDAFVCYVRIPDILKVGIEKLASWWSAVEGRGKRDETPANILREQLEKLDRIIQALTKYESSQEDLIRKFQNEREHLYEKMQVYLSTVVS